MELTIYAAIATTACLALTACGPGEDVDSDRLEGETAVWNMAEGQDLTSSSTEFTAVVSRLACNGGVTGEVFPPQIRMTGHEVVVTFSVAPKRPGAATCQGNDWVPYKVTLDEPLGDRALSDGACQANSGGAATTSFCLPSGTRFEP
ncbi:MAG TPA: hypothetical protein VFK41_08970 [Nocardioidaceae bacterium]|nr:hypothetical protein [Nocardioidaceae bacterium]